VVEEGNRAHEREIEDEFIQPVTNKDTVDCPQAKDAGDGFHARRLTFWLARRFHNTQT
jgi:hypothetical protein